MGFLHFTILRISAVKVNLFFDAIGKNSVAANTATEP